MFLAKLLDLELNSVKFEIVFDDDVTIAEILENFYKYLGLTSIDRTALKIDYITYKEMYNLFPQFNYIKSNTRFCVNKKKD